VTEHFKKGENKKSLPFSESFFIVAVVIALNLEIWPPILERIIVLIFHLLIPKTMNQFSGEPLGFFK
tara:strand:- start:20 stop:220 length:201 start_codon:yes stop_codon:yes gene_type:complete